MAKGILAQLLDLAKAVASAARSAPPEAGSGSSHSQAQRQAQRQPQRPAAPPRRPSSSSPAPGEVRYAPQADGHADPGEVVWAWVPYEEDASRGKDRPVLVLDVRDGGDVVGLMLTSKDHAGPRTQGERDHDGRRWMDVGTGAWDSQRRPSEVRLDRVLHLPADAVRREGSALPRDVFERVVAAYRSQ